MDSAKVAWEGKILAVQPRIRLRRSFDERDHSYLGFMLHLEGDVGEETGKVLIGIGKAAQEKHEFRRGDVASGASVPITPSAVEVVEYYKTSALKVIERGEREGAAHPPWHGVPPGLPIYRVRGHRRISARTYASKCTTCIWGCKMAVEMIIDHWNTQNVRHRTETFCYGPKSCSFYKAGPTRKVPGRKGMVWEEEDWVDDEATAHRGEDE